MPVLAWFRDLIIHVARRASWPFFTAWCGVLAYFAALMLSGRLRLDGSQGDLHIVALVAAFAGMVGWTSWYL